MNPKQSPTSRDTRRPAPTGESCADDLTHLALQQIRNNPDQRIFKIIHRQQTFWIKQSQDAQYRIWHFLGKIAAIVSRNPLLKPTVATIGSKALKAEAARLRRLASLGVNVPDVVAEGNGWIMLKDIGLPLSDWLRDANVSRQDKRKIVRQASEQLAQLHNLSLWHGRPAFKDMTYDGQSFGFLDFEEDPERTLTPAQCQMRDALLYFHSLHRYLDGDRQLILEAIECYRRLAPDSVWRNTRAFAKRAWLIYGLLTLLHRHFGKDARYAYRTLKTLRNYQDATNEH